MKKNLKESFRARIRRGFSNNRGDGYISFLFIFMIFLIFLGTILFSIQLRLELKRVRKEIDSTAEDVIRDAREQVYNEIILGLSDDSFRGDNEQNQKIVDTYFNENVIFQQMAEKLAADQGLVDDKLVIQKYDGLGVLKYQISQIEIKYGDSIEDANGSGNDSEYEFSPGIDYDGNGEINGNDLAAYADMANAGVDINYLYPVEAGDADKTTVVLKVHYLIPVKYGIFDFGNYESVNSYVFELTFKDFT